MKITRIDAYQVKYRLLDKSYAWSAGRSVETFLSNIVKVSTDAGIAGFGEVCPLGSSYMDAFAGGVPAGIRELGPALLGVDPRQIRPLNALMDSRLSGHNYMKSPIDIACWDILGKVAGLPVATCLGGLHVTEYPLYRAISMRTPEEMAADVARYRSEGYHRFQLKVGGNPDDDIRRVKAVLRVLGAGDVLVADANTGWREHEARRVANALRNDTVYLEAPCATYEECLSIREHSGLPFILDELMTGMVPLLRAWADRAMDIINLKISRVGGLSKAVQMRNACEALGLGMTIEDSWGGDIATTAIAHLVGSTRPEFLFTSTDFNSYIDLSVAPDAPRRVNGRLSVPNRPGLGITVDEAVLGTPVVTVT